MANLIVSIPHSGEQIPPEAAWLKGLPEEVLMFDVDRYVDRLYLPALTQLKIPWVIAKWHRYSGDLNRLPEDVDASTVEGHSNKAGTFSRGFLWAITTTGQKLMPGPISQEVHQILVKNYFEPFHTELKNKIKSFQGEVFHIDAHSMPSVGTSEHRDPGKARADFVISDQKGKSCKPEFLDLVVKAYASQGFKVKVNWPYYGGRITEMYGQPAKGHHTVQVEMNRALYMDEITKKLIPLKAEVIQKALAPVLQAILNSLSTT